MIDTHAYWDPIGESTSFSDTSLLADSSRWLERLAVCQAGKPCTLSEINTTWPNRYAHEAPLTWATLAARQGFDAVLWFAWSHDDVRDLPDGPAGALDLEGRASSDVQLWSAGQLFRRLSPAPGAFTRWWSDAGLARDLAEPSSLPLPETVGITSWLDRRIRVDFGGPDARTPEAIPLGVDRVRWSPGRLVVETPTVQAVVGHTLPTDASPNPSGLRVHADTSVAVSVVNITNNTYHIDDTWLLTVAGRTDRLGSLWTRGVPGMRVLGGGPSVVERLSGSVHLWGSYAGEAAWLNADRTPRASFSPVKTSFGTHIDLGVDSPQLLFTSRAR